MNQLVGTLMGLGLAATGSLGWAAPAAEPPHGGFLELHSCEVYAGGCIVSSEAPQGGRYMIRVWDFKGGSFGGVDFSGLRLAVLELAHGNLAAPGTKPAQSVAYLPEVATTDQRRALMAWLRQTSPLAGTAHERTVALKLGGSPDGTTTFTAGGFLTIRMRPMEACDTGNCGEQLWYDPRTPASVFTVGVNRAAQVREPLLDLTWADAGKRSGFLGRFGDAPPQRVYVTSAELCGSLVRLF